MAKTKYEYFIKRKGPIDFEVAKFEDFGGSQPVSLYKVVWDPHSGKGKCDCPAYVYRQMGTNDKHIQMVKQWVANGDSFHPPTPGVPAKGKICL